jgi:tetratricopeptide (TPR) repeat protein
MNSLPNPAPGPDIQSLEAKAWALLEAEHYEDALQAFAEVFQIDPLNVAAFQGTTAAHRKKRDFAMAKEVLAKALQAHPAEPGILSERAWLHLEQKQYDEAITAFDDLLKNFKKDEGLFVWQTSLLRGQRRLDEAEKTIAEAVALFPLSLRVRNEQGWLLFYQRRYDEALETFRKVLDADPKNEAGLQGRIACLRMQGCFADALDFARQALQQLPKSPGIRSESGWLNFERGDLDQAITDFGEALNLAPQDPFAHINLAWALVRRNEDQDLEKAADFCRRARQLDTTLPEAFGLLGVIAFKQNKLREAEAHLLRSVRLDPVRGYFTDLGALYIQMGRYEEAKERIDQALLNNPGDAYARIQKGNFHLLTDSPKKAVREFRSGVALDPQNPETHQSLAIALQESDKLREAEQVLRKAISQLDESGRWRLHLTLCQVLTRLGDTGEVKYYEEALEEVRQAMRTHPGQSAVYFHSGVVRFKLDDPWGAVQDFGRCPPGDEYHLEADLNAKRIRARIQQERVRARASLFATVLLAVVLLVQLIALWLLRIWTDRVTETSLTVLVPILLGLLVVALLLPWLTRFKMTGFEAELSEPKPKEALATGPKGEIGFGSVSPKSG